MAKRKPRRGTKQELAAKQSFAKETGAAALQKKLKGGRVKAEVLKVRRQQKKALEKSVAKTFQKIKQTRRNK
jgi:hypothetical protein